MRSLVVLAMLVPAAVSAEGRVCKLVDLDFQPQQLATQAMYRAPSQIVVWIENPAGQYVDTIFITQQTGTYGLGNRPGRADFNSGPRWPYGRRTMIFPVWAHRHGLQFDAVVFQNGDEDNLSHPFNESSRENRFCRPLSPTIDGDKQLWDAGTCASAVFTDKGTLSQLGVKSLYPPRNDLVRGAQDDLSVEMFAMLNPFDAVSQPTPPNDTPAELTWVAPETVPDGNYVLWVEVSREFDHNATYSIEARPSPLVPWAEYGAPFRGQPSIVYSVPFTITQGQRSIAHGLDYVGYGDPDGLDGNLRAPDGTITTGVAGSGAERFAVRTDNGTPYRVRVSAFTEDDPADPAAPASMKAEDVSTISANISFKAPGDDGFTGKARRLEIRYVVGNDFDEASFSSGIELKPDLLIGEGGETLTFPFTGLLNGTEYTVGIRAYDDCLNKGPVSFVTFTTPDRLEGEVDWCFVATAAYGTTLANDVAMLRRFRDSFLQSTVLGELAVEAYYTFSPALARVVGESEVLRATARAVLAPIVKTVKVLRF